MSNHGKMPDVVLHYPERHRLRPVESVTSHGPVDGKRHAELARLFDLFCHPPIRRRSGEQFEIWAKQKPLDSAARFLRFRAVLPNRG
jgi:hypothetical protein